jgi:dTDP-4-amino-4,6-dideoxygalactose transaminase
VGARHACAVSSCTTALHLALLAVGVKPGDVVVTVSHSFIATANAVRYCGAEPVFVDIDPHTYNIDQNDLLRLLTDDCQECDGAFYYRHIDRIAVGESPLRFHCELAGSNSDRLGRVAAIIPVHQMGIPFDVQRILSIAKEFGLPVVEDAACAIGSEISFDGGNTWDKIGKPHGEIACFSFHPRKIITTGDGGMLTTNKHRYDNTFRLLRQHGMSIPDTTRHMADKVIFEEYTTTAFNFRMTDIQAAVGIEQLKKLDTILIKRHELADQYSKLIRSIKYLTAPKLNHRIRPNWQSYPIRLLEGAHYSQSKLMQLLLEKRIATRRGIMNAHQELAYIDAHWSLPHSELSRDHVLLLPLFPGLTLKDQTYIFNTLKEILE